MGLRNELVVNIRICGQASLMYCFVFQSHTGAVITYVQTNHEDGAANPEIDDSVSYNGLFLREKFPASSKLASYQR